ncbi:ribose 5-phosphate isomerase B [Enterococcus olivae]
MKIAIGNDHGGYELKSAIVEHLQAKGIEVTDVGTDSATPGDYPDYAKQVSQKVVEKEVDYGILVCGTGIGMSIAANKVEGIRAALVGDVFSAKATKEHNNTNVLCLGQRVLGEGLALMIVDTWVSTEYSTEERHERRLQKLAKIEQGN